MVSVACATTAKAFGQRGTHDQKRDYLRDAAIVGGADTLCATTIYGFRFLGTHHRRRLAAPSMWHVDGISIGEASGFAIVEKATDQRLPPHAVLLRGVGESSDAYHMSTPHPAAGAGARLAMERALAAAGNDTRRHRLHQRPWHRDAYRRRCRGPRRGLNCSAGKRHAVRRRAIPVIRWAPPALWETIIATLAIQHGFSLPRAARIRTRSIPHCAAAPISPRAVVRRSERVMSNSFGFGGSNCSLVLERAS